MLKMNSKISMFLGIFHIFLQNLYAAPVPPCFITPSHIIKSENELSIICTAGEAEVLLDEASKTRLTSEDSYQLHFSKTILNKPRVIYIEDSETEEKVLKINVLADRALRVEGLIGDKAWYFDGFHSLDLKTLEISAEGSVIIQDEIELDHLLEIKTQQLYFLSPFSVRNGTFSFKYQEGYLPRLNSPFEMEQEEDYSVIHSMSTVRTPSKRRTQLNQIESTSYDVSLADLLATYEEVFEVALNTKYPLYLKKKTNADRLSYIKKHVLPHITDNVKKGEFGEVLYRRHMSSKHPSYAFHDSKLGLNSFDGIFIRNQTGSDTEISNILISEVKYAAHGQPVLGVVKLNGHDWRQLSTPYVHYILEKMKKNAGTRDLALSVLNNKSKVKLQLAVFNPNELKLVLYKIGNMDHSKLD